MSATVDRLRRKGARVAGRVRAMAPARDGRDPTVVVTDEEWWALHVWMESETRWEGGLLVGDRVVVRRARQPAHSGRAR